MQHRILIGVFIAWVIYLNTFCDNRRNLTSNEIKIDSTSKHTPKFSYKVYKIDSINDYYLIYVVRDKERYKVISKKNLQSSCSMISLGKMYDLKLTYVFGAIAGGVFKPNCLSVDNKTKVCLEDSIIDLCYSESLKGLCVETGSVSY